MSHYNVDRTHVQAAAKTVNRVHSFEWSACSPQKMQTWRTEKTEKGAPHLQRRMQLRTQQSNAKPQIRQLPGRLTGSAIL